MNTLYEVRDEPQVNHAKRDALETQARIDCFRANEEFSFTSDEAAAFLVLWLPKIGNEILQSRRDWATSKPQFWQMAMNPGMWVKSMTTEARDAALADVDARLANWKRWMRK